MQTGHWKWIFKTAFCCWLPPSPAKKWNPSVCLMYLWGHSDKYDPLDKGWYGNPPPTKVWSGNAPENIRLSGQQESANNTINQQALTTLNDVQYKFGDHVSMMICLPVCRKRTHFIACAHVGVGWCWSPHCFTLVRGIRNRLGANSQTVTKNIPSDITPVLLRPSLEHASESDTAAQKREPLEAQYFAWSRHLSFSASCECNKPGHDA
jgi:hypothetical protein